MNRRTKYIIGGTAVAALALGGSGLAIAASSDDDGTDTPISGPALEQASTVALAYTHGGRVTETEVNDEESYYQVEVTLDNGKQVDVNLDKSFNVVKTKTDSEDDG